MEARFHSRFGIKFFIYLFANYVVYRITNHKESERVFLKFVKSSTYSIQAHNKRRIICGTISFSLLYTFLMHLH